MSHYFKNLKFDVFPLVFPAGQAVEFTVKSDTAKKALCGAYTVKILRVDGGSPTEEFNKWNCVEIDCNTDENGNLKFSYTAESECEHYFRIYRGDAMITQLSVYAVEGELAKRLPLKGDLHLHTTGSDGKEDPQRDRQNASLHR